ncbi:MAG: hypothetical protein JWN67_5203 [Actinomycetia bacterium]|nr:hypothetical protein [Actinomycetes bacterium]
MTERSEGIMNTGFGEALCAEPVIGGLSAHLGQTCGHDVGGHR